MRRRYAVLVAANVPSGCYIRRWVREGIMIPAVLLLSGNAFNGGISTA
jgi:hypothetical protein